MARDVNDVLNDVAFSENRGIGEDHLQDICMDGQGQPMRRRHSSDEQQKSSNRYRQMGFTRGFSLGEEAGWRDGYSYGLQRGAQIASELGFYQGFVHAWITVLEREESSKQRKLTALKSLLEMTKNFSRTSMHEEESAERLQKIRAKFKQVVSLLNVSAESTELEPENQRPEMSF